MNRKTQFLVIFLSLLAIPVFPQEKSRREIKDSQKLEKREQTTELINSGDFIFIARRALPQGIRSVDLTTTPNFIRFNAEEIESDLPFYGRAYSAVGFSGDAGMKFRGKPEGYSYITKKNNYQVEAVVNDDGDTYRIKLLVNPEGTATLTLISNRKSTISYTGDILSPDVLKKKEKK